MQQIIEKIEALKFELNQLSPMKEEYKSRLEKKFRLEFNYNSNHIEGNTLTYNETELLLIFDETKGNHTLREYEEMKAHDVALKLIQEWANESERPLTENTIKNLNKIILVKPFWKDAITPSGDKTKRLIKVGDYKEYPNSVKLSNGEIFEYASVTDTPILMAELIEWYRKEETSNLHPVALSALLHYKFVRIHPFDDGNGRISRLLMNYVLYKNNFPPIVIKSNDKHNYLSSLKSADTGDINTFIEYIATQLVWSLDLALKAAKGEELEEQDDIEKEIAIWKRQALTNPAKSIRRNDQIIKDFYNSFIKDLLEKFAEKHSQFYDLFASVDSVTLRNNGGQSGIQWLTKLINTEEKTTNPTNDASIENLQALIPKDTFMNISIQIRLQEYKYNEKNPFSVISVLKFQFEPFKYSIKFAKRQLVKSYREFVTEEEKTTIISESLKSIFEEIKNKSEKE